MKVYGVSALARALDELLSEQSFIVQGEVSNFNISQNKWVFFDLKDDESKIGCFLTSFNLKVLIEDGMEIRVLGSPGVYAPQGRLTFRVQAIELVGEGALSKLYEQTFAKLKNQGLFDERYKKPLPELPQNIGLITSEQAAAYTDFLRILNNRWNGLNILFANVPVQGPNSAEEIIKAIEYFNQTPDLNADVLVITRGGGSLEDLQSFNSEQVARAIFASHIPVVVGVGHERDTTLADFAADRRASTPSNTAEIIIPDKTDFLWRIQKGAEDIERCVTRLIESKNLFLDESTGHIAEIMDRRIAKGYNMVDDMMSRYMMFGMHIKRNNERLRSLNNMLESRMSAALERSIGMLNTISASLLGINPSAVLRRGYSMTKDAKTGASIKDAGTLKKGSKIKTVFRSGEAESTIDNVRL